MTPLSADRVDLRFSVSRITFDKMRYALELLGHQVSPGDFAQLQDRAFDALIARLEKQKFAATEKPRTACTARTS